MTSEQVQPAQSTTTRPITSEEIKAHAKALNASASIDPYGGYGRAPTPHIPVAPEACPSGDGMPNEHAMILDLCGGPATPASAAGREGAVEVGAHAMEVAERCFYAIKGGAPYRESIRAMAAIIESERALLAAEAEGGGA